MNNITKESPYTARLEQLFIGEDDESLPVGIFLHGFGSNPTNMVGVAEKLLDKVPYWIVPQAPIKLIDFLAYHAFAWFPSDPKQITEVLIGNYWKKINEIDIQDLQIVAKKIIGEIILPLRQISPIRPIVLAGFSQGGMLSTEIILHCLQLNIVIAQLLLCSSSVIAETRWNNIATQYITNGKSRVKPPKIFQSHGLKDHVLNWNHGQTLKNFWKQYTTVDFIQFNGEHEISPKVIQCINAFLSKL